MDLSSNLPLKEKIQNDLKTAMRAKDKELVGAIRLLTAEIKQVEVDKRIELNDADIIAIIEKMIKQRKESFRQYEDAGRNDLADKEYFEIEMLKTYLPKPLTSEEVQVLVKNTINELGASTLRDMAKVMATLKPQVQGRTDMEQLSKIVKELLA